MRCLLPVCRRLVVSLLGLLPFISGPFFRNISNNMNKGKTFSFKRCFFPVCSFGRENRQI